MPYYDLPKDLLRSYSPPLRLPDGGAEFWSSTVEESRSLAKPPRFEPRATPLRLVETFDVTFSGFAGQEIRAWLQLPAGAFEPLPAVVTFQGYGGGRGLPIEISHFALAGYATLVVDTRGQGSTWRTGDTPDLPGADPSHPGFLTRGVLDPDEYYYRRLYTDAVLAVDAVRSHRLVRRDQVAAAGISQGGGIALAVAGLVPDLWCALVDVPFLCDFARATQLVDSDPYGELVRYLKVHRDQTEAVFETLSYFDAVAFAGLATAPALFSVGLMDEVCPPSTVYAAYNRYAGPKQIVEYPFNGHEGGEAHHQVAQLRWLEQLAVGEPSGR